MVDEEIAKVLRKQRLNKKKETEKELDREIEQIDENEILEMIQKGHVELWDIEYKFKNYFILQQRVSINLPEYCDFVVETDKDFLYNTYSNYLGYSCNVSLMTDIKELEPMSIYKERMEKGTKKSGIHYRWEEEGILFVRDIKISFLGFEINTGLMSMYCCMYYIITKYGRLTVTMNADSKDKKKWKIINKGLIQTIQIR